MDPDLRLLLSICEEFVANDAAYAPDPIEPNACACPQCFAEWHFTHDGAGHETSATITHEPGCLILRARDTIARLKGA